MRFFLVLNCGDEGSPASNIVTSAEFPGDSLGLAEVSIRPFTVLATARRWGAQRWATLRLGISALSGQRILGPPVSGRDELRGLFRNDRSRPRGSHLSA
jgi:hypothetical protein